MHEVTTPLEILGGEFDCLIKFDYTPPFRGSRDEPPHDEEFDNIELFILTNVKGKRIVNDASFLLDEHDVMKYIIETLNSLDD